MPLLRKDIGPFIDLTNVSDFPPLPECPELSSTVSSFEDHIIDLNISEFRDLSSLPLISESQIEDFFQTVPTEKNDIPSNSNDSDCTFSEIGVPLNDSDLKVFDADNSLGTHVSGTSNESGNNNPEKSDCENYDNDKQEPQNIDNDKHKPENIVTDHVEFLSENIGCVGSPIAGNKFVDVNKLLHILNNETVAIQSKIPNGLKENCIFLVKRCGVDSFMDDCGAWQKSSLKKHEYLVDEKGNLTGIYKKNGFYCISVKKKYVPLENQPQDKDIITLKRYYSKLKKNNEYQRRVTWIEKSNGTENKQLIEYIGEFPGHTSHGNAKLRTNEYIRVSTEKRKIIDAGISNNLKPIQIQKKVNSVDPENPIGCKTVQNAKYNLTKKERPYSYIKNSADEVQAVLNQLQTNPFIRTVIANDNNKPPAIICYSNEQLELMKNAVSSGSVIGIDRTFNLGACFVTSLVFQNHNLIRSGTSTNPILLGPTYLHWDGSYQTYSDFLSKVRSSLGFSFPTEKIIFGSDEEQALSNALRSSFPSSKQILCTRHLVENTKRQLDKSQVSENIQKVLINDLFGGKGILTCSSKVSFIEKKQELLDQFSNIGFEYLKEKLLPVLYQYVFLSRLENPSIPPLWKNNNCESMHHKIKLLGDWHISKLPSLIERLQDIDISQMLDIRGALHGRGNFQLAPTALDLKINHNTWMTMDESMRNRLLTKFFKFAPQNNKMVSSTDLTLDIPTTSKIAKKPGQVKRVRSTKTFTIQNKKYKCSQ